MFLVFNHYLHILLVIISLLVEIIDNTGGMINAIKRGLFNYYW